ncbi:PREDICTED: proteasome assembly chaperone 2 [Polistes canadensis]|uniref:proteasome assembly chaperone 2 n=1 Tax=Polistes canadensis TaxID=91411 RepID=UPI000718F3F6|nr:PREDICTED: proteasome assembly chaperone 2 [Polistes canadensis]
MIKLTKQYNLEGFSLIIPSVAVGNVAQLTVDLLIASLNLQRIGQIVTSAFIPIVGLDPYVETSEHLSTAIDLYAGLDNKILVIQIRSPFIKSLNNFYHSLLQFITANKISKIVILTSSYAYEKTDTQINVTELRYIASASILTNNKQIFDDSKWLQYESKYTSCPNDQQIVHIPGGGFATNLFHYLSNNNVPCIILFKFCSEGDNIPDALNLLNYLNQWMKLLKMNSSGSLDVKYPPSWKYLFGNVPSSEIY